jgi:hypothetical protein
LATPLAVGTPLALAVIGDKPVPDVVVSDPVEDEGGTVLFWLVAVVAPPAEAEPLDR